MVTCMIFQNYVMVRAASGPESPFETAFNDLIEVIPELAEPEMYNSNAQIVPEQDSSSFLMKGHLEEAKLYGSDTNLTKVKEEPSGTMTLECHYTTPLPSHAASYLPVWLTTSLMLDQDRGLTSDPFISRRIPDAESFGELQWYPVKHEPTDHGDQLLIQQTQHIVQATSFAPESRDYFMELHRNPSISNIHLEAEPSWCGGFEDEDPFVNMDNTTDLSELSSDPCLSENNSDTEITEVKPRDETVERNEKIWFGRTAASSLHPRCVPEGPFPKKESKKSKATFKSGRPRLCQFLIELLSKPERYSHLIEWVDEEKGIFKFINSTKVAREWGERRNKPFMKYENFARSLRTYIAKGILTKPRSKLVYRFSNV
ncbi:uncharacterized protein LOC5521528 isoform X1 [Nematostella vectensis]|uniref:uncharacterized protein LOC5521528 isoform X1 n=2 Tax=Nematostella vectensis TaxID=45351 RepID=UPI0020777524|nr:uncharacterized protein LOC5521528 isoform X1 [Nematostella vectensis]